MVSKNKRTKREKIFAIIMPLAIVCALSYGIYSVASSTDNARKNNIVNLNDTDDGNVAIRTEDVTDLSDGENLMSDNNGKDMSDNDKSDKNSSENKDTANPVADAAAGNEAVSGVNFEADSGINENVNSFDNNKINTEANPDIDADKLLNNRQDTLAQGYTFGEADTLLWPVSGDIILKYSMDSTIYFPTLGVYKCNPSISIQASEGTNVGVAASGIVKNVSVNEETGTTVDVAIGDGYVTTYGLLDNVVVRAGDKVTKGQLLGTVSQPTAYYTKEGANLYFKVTKDGESVDPVELFED